MATLIINGQEVHAEDGQTILEVAKANGIEIPTLCYHPLLEPYGACRLCTVEIIRRGWSQLETSCTYPARDGIEVKTNSPPVIEARKAILGLFLSRCPNVPVIQDLARQYGVTEPPFPVKDPNQGDRGFVEERRGSVRVLVNDFVRSILEQKGGILTFEDALNAPHDSESNVDSNRTVDAFIHGNLKNNSITAGQGSSMITDIPTCQEIIERMMGEAEQVLGRLNGIWR